MADKPSDLVQGTLDMLILKTLALQPMHGYGIGVRLEQISKGVFRLNAGSLFVAFQRLQRAGLIRSEWKATEHSRRAKYTPSQARDERGSTWKHGNGEGKWRRSAESWRRPKRTMSFLRSMAGGLRSLFRKERVEAELDEELRVFVEMAAEKKMKEGMSREG